MRERRGFCTALAVRQACGQGFTQWTHLGIDALTGEPVWVNPLAVDGNGVASHPVTDRGLVFLTLRHFTNPSTGGVVALDALTGAIRWQHDFPSTGPGRGTGSYGRAGIWHDLVIAAADDGTIYALNRDTGTVVWVSPRPADEGGHDDQRPITVVGDVVAVGSDRPVLAGLDAATGQQRWTIPSAFGSVNYQMGSDGQYLYLPYVSLQVHSWGSCTHCPHCSSDPRSPFRHSSLPAP